MVTGQGHGGHRHGARGRFPEAEAELGQLRSQAELPPLRAEAVSLPSRALPPREFWKLPFLSRFLTQPPNAALYSTQPNLRDLLFTGREGDGEEEKKAVLVMFLTFCM